MGIVGKSRRKRIPNHSRSLIEVDPVFPNIRWRLRRVPFEDHNASIRRAGRPAMAPRASGISSEYGGYSLPSAAGARL